MKEHQVGCFFLERVQPMPITMKGKVTRPIARRNSNRGTCNGRQLPCGEIKSVNVDPVLPQVCLQHEAIARVSLDHMRVRVVVAAHCETSGRRTRCELGTDRTCVLMNVRGCAQRPCRLYGQHRYCAA